MSQQQKYKVYIAVYKGEPVDFQKYRHTGLWFVPEESGSTLFCHVTGSTGDFTFESRTNYNPTSSETLAKTIEVGATQQKLTAAALLGEMQACPVRNDDMEFNCHGWVEAALKRLSLAGYLTNEEYENGFDKMMDATLEAEQDQYAF